MRITIESTDRLVEVNGVPARVWEGTTDTGIPVTALVTRIACEEGPHDEQFRAELRECRPPQIIGAWPARLVL